MFKKIIIICLFIIFAINLPADMYNRKDPFLAGVLSWYMAGLGQFYANDYLKGSVFWFVDNALFISTLLTVADITFSVSKDIGFQFNIKPKETLSMKEKSIAITLFCSYILFHVYNVIDAIKSVKKKNLNIKEASSLFLEYYYANSNNFFSFNIRI